MPEIVLPGLPALFDERGKGTYVLILRWVTPATVTIGELGAFSFAAGWYAYAGSAFGAGGLRGRLKHHLSPVKKPHWHIDYLRQSARLHEIWYLASETVYEHEWATLLGSMPDAVSPIPRFGASDCNCQTHLFHFANCPDFAEFSALAHQNSALRCWKPEN